MYNLGGFNFRDGISELQMKLPSCAPGFLKLILCRSSVCVFACVCVCVCVRARACVCVSAPEAVNN